MSRTDPATATDRRIGGRAGVRALRGRRWSHRPAPLAWGLLLYAVVNAAGFYAQTGNLVMVATFGVLAGTTLLLAGQHLTGADRPRVRRDRPEVAGR
jgi:hypothetical protein